MTTKHKRFKYYVLDLDWLVTEAHETYGWRFIPLPILASWILDKSCEEYLLALKAIHELNVMRHSGMMAPPSLLEDLEALEEYWVERHRHVVSRIEKMMDIENVLGAFTFYKWLPNNHIILKEVIPCYIPPLDHLVSGRLW